MCHILYAYVEVSSGMHWVAERRKSVLLNTFELYHCFFFFAWDFGAGISPVGYKGVLACAPKRLVTQKSSGEKRLGFKDHQWQPTQRKEASSLSGFKARRRKVAAFLPFLPLSVVFVMYVHVQKKKNLFNSPKNFSRRFKRLEKYS